MLVLAVGSNSVAGKTLAMMTGKVQTTPLQAKLEILAEQIGQLGLGAAIFTVVALFIQFLVHYFGHNLEWEQKYLVEFMHFFVTVCCVVLCCVRMVVWIQGNASAVNCQ